MIRGLAGIALVVAAFTFDHVSVLGAALALAAGVALVIVWRHYHQQH